MSDQFDVICTDRGQHAALSIGGLILDDDGRVRAVTVRKAAAPQLQDASATLPEDADIHQMPNYTYVNAPDVSDDYEGRRRFRFPCKVCGRDKPMREDTAATLLAGLLATRRHSFDASLLP